jgi:pSer/pThr/pTyr-binding forkhead associated (FHA) protein
MNLIGWNILLLILKFVLIGLIYWVLLNVLRAVRREMAMRLESGAQEVAIVPGRLRVTNPGASSRLRFGEVINLRTETNLGAEADNAVILSDPYVSGHHARLRWDGVGWWIEDLGSRNGTFVNQSRVPPYTPQPVPTGAAIQVGGAAFVLLET